MASSSAASFGAMFRTGPCPLPEIRLNRAPAVAARGEIPAAFAERRLPPPLQSGDRVGGAEDGCVAYRSLMANPLALPPSSGHAMKPAHYVEIRRDLAAAVR